MKSILCLSIAVVFGLIETCSADTGRYVTIIASNSTTNTTSISIQETETIELVSATGVGGYASSQPVFTVTKSGITFPAYPGFVVNGSLANSSYGASEYLNNYPKGTIVAGPATVSLSVGGCDSALLTVKITPESVDPGKTLILAPTTNQVHVTLESSTNLVNWADATNGVYGTPDSAYFFRVKMSKIASP